MINKSNLLHKKGLDRDKSILLAIEDYGVLDAEQVRLLLFNQGFKDDTVARRKTQERLLALYRKKKVYRWRGDDPMFVYSLDAKTRFSEHRVDLNWVRLWFDVTKKSWEVIHCWQYEQKYKSMRPDGLCAIKNKVTDKMRFLFLELDRSPSNAFDKVEKYCQLYDSGECETQWWATATDRFPGVFIATTSAARKEKIESLVREQNSVGIEFTVRLLDDIRGEVLRCGSVTQ